MWGQTEKNVYLKNAMQGLRLAQSLIGLMRCIDWLNNYQVLAYWLD